MDIASIGKFLKKSRRHHGLTQGDVAEHLGVSPQAVSKWERGENLPDMAFLPDISKLLEIGVDEILNAGRADEGKDDSIQKLVDTPLFEKIIASLQQADSLAELALDLDFFVYLGTAQKSDTIAALLNMSDYHLALDEILPYCNQAQRGTVVEHVLEERDYDILEQISSHMSNELKATALEKLLEEGEYEIIEDNMPAFNRKHRDIIAEHFYKTKTDIDIIENFIPFFDKNQRTKLEEELS
ncbi:MAG: helix-turn-helix domain-containing protein [Defluviitaleaceae bacterium]|nr:helix-turn-helix domain-containing protein [Defluviitaleaceae bacterium]